jgi:hypothetical protein
MRNAVLMRPHQHVRAGARAAWGFAGCGPRPGFSACGLGVYQASAGGRTTVASMSRPPTGWWQCEQVR